MVVTGRARLPSIRADRPAAEYRKRPQRNARETPLLTGVSELPVDHPADADPEELGTRDLPGGARPAVERLLELPGGAVERRELGVHGGLVWRKRIRAPAQELE